jgi:acetyl-CoA C-acetyltransferase
MHTRKEMGVENMNNDYLDEVAIVGVGCTRFGEQFDKSYADLAVDAAYEAIADAGIEPKDIQAAWLGSQLPTDGLEGNCGIWLADYLGIFDIPVGRCTAACASGMEAFRNAVFGVASGKHDIVLVVGVEKMRDIGPRMLIDFVAERGHPSIRKGISFPGFFALMFNRYLYRYGISPEMGRKYLTQITMQNHYNGSLNPKAHFQKPVTVEEILKSPMVAEPVHLLDCCPTTDGGAALVLMRKKVATEMKKNMIHIRGLSKYVSWPWNEGFDARLALTSFDHSVKAAQDVYQQANIKNPVEDLDVVEVHDCFSPAQFMDMEDLGLSEKGKIGDLLLEGVFTLEGKLPVNTGGGVLCSGHPVGATGPRMLYVLAKQLQGKAGKFQVRGDPHIGLAQNLGGYALVVTVILSN